MRGEPQHKQRNTHSETHNDQPQQKRLGRRRRRAASARTHLGVVARVSSIALVLLDGFDELEQPIFSHNDRLFGLLLCRFEFDKRLGAREFVGRATHATTTQPTTRHEMSHTTYTHDMHTRMQLDTNFLVLLALLLDHVDELFELGSVLERFVLCAHALNVFMGVFKTLSSTQASQQTNENANDVVVTCQFTESSADIFG